jgi:glycine cleavage system H lipoate-binding protein
MVPILVLASVLAFLVIDGLLSARKRAARAKAAVGTAASATGRTTATAPSGLFFHPGHAWASCSPTGYVTAGADVFALGFAGELGTIELPLKGARLAKGDRAWTLVSRSGRRLPMAAPLAGEVIEVNEALRDHPDRARQLPYGEGWILRIRPDDAGGSLASLLPARLAGAWMELVRAQAVSRLRPELGALAADGGPWEVSFGDRLSDARWQDLRCALFPQVDFTGGGDAAPGSR